MKLKKWMAMFLAGAMCVGVMAGCGEKPLNVPEDDASTGTYQGDLTLVISHKDEYLGSLDQAAKASAEARGCTLTSLECGDDMDRQIQYVQAAADNGAKAVIVVLVDDMRANEIVEAAGDAKVVFVNRIPKDTSILNENCVYIGSDEDTSGTYQGEMLADYFKKEGKDNISYIMFQGTEGLLHTEKRSEGVLKALDSAGITATPAATAPACGYDRSQAMDQMIVLLAEGLDMSEVDCIISNNDAMAMGVIEALEQNQIDMSGIQIVGVDGTNAGLQAITDGTMLATVYQDAVGQASAGVQAAINLAGGVDATTGVSFETDDENQFIIWVPFEKITAENVDMYF